MFSRLISGTGITDATSLDTEDVRNEASTSIDPSGFPKQGDAKQYDYKEKRGKDYHEPDMSPQQQRSTYTLDEYLNNPKHPGRWGDAYFATRVINQ